MPRAHGIHTEGGYPRLLADRALRQGRPLEASSVYVARTDDLPGTADELTTHVKLSGPPDLVFVATGHLCALRSVLPAGSVALLLKEALGRSLGRFVFAANAIFHWRWVFDAFGRPLAPLQDPRALDSFVDSVRRRWPMARIIVVSPLPCKANASAFDLSILDRLTRDLRAACRRCAVPFVDVSRTLPDSLPRCANGLNLGPAGHDIVAATLAPFVYEALSEQRAVLVPAAELDSSADLEAAASGFE